MCLGVGLGPFRNFAQQLCIAPIVWLVYYHLLRHDVAFLAHAQKIHQQVSVSVEVKHCRVFVGLVGYKHSQRHKHHRGQQFAEPNDPDAAARHLIARIVKDVIHDEHQHRHDNGYSQPALTDDCAKRGADEEENKARQGQHKLLVHLYLVLPYHAVSIFRHHRLELQVGIHGLHLRTGYAQHTSLSVVIQSGKGTIHVKSLLSCLLYGGQSVGSTEARRVVIAHLHLIIKHAPNTVVVMLQRVEVAIQLCQSFSTSIAREQSGIRHIKVAIKVYERFLLQESLPSEGRGSIPTHLLRLIREPFAVPQREQQVLFLGRCLQHARVGQYNFRVFVAIAHAVNHDAIELTRLYVFLLHVDVAVRNAIVEHPLGYFQLRVLLFHRHKQLRKLDG